jgi:4-hydroxybenzoate polyprenyltransferase
LRGGALQVEHTGIGFRQGKLWPYLQLMRPPNLVTALADVLAGFGVAAMANFASLPWLLVSTICLYGGGVVLNDVFDRHLDGQERPERPLPSGRATVRRAALLGSSLLAFGTGAAFMVSAVSGSVALLIAFCAVLYDWRGKHRTFFGPINMGVCRGLNLMLGVSAAPALIGERWYLTFIPIAYIAAITAVSTGEVEGGKRSTGLLALVLLALVVVALPVLTLTPAARFAPMLPFLMLFLWRVLPAFWRAYLKPDPDRIRSAVKAGVLSLIVLDAAIAAGYAGLLYGAVVLSLMFVAGFMARLFAVT